MSAANGPLNWAVIGAGAGVAAVHQPAWDDPARNVVAIAEIDETRRQQAAEGMGARSYRDAGTLLEAERHRVDAVAVLTPHASHADMAIACVDAGLHVLVEKPLSLLAGDADRAVRAAQRAGVVLGVVHQHRFREAVLQARRLLAAGTLGTIQHVSVRAAWPRSHAYYGASDWRGTWEGEGGGVLVNQAPHLFDLICHLLGPPDEAQAYCSRLLHTIEPEDTVDALLRWSGDTDATGVVHISTGQALQPERIELFGTRGSIELTPDRLVLREMADDLQGLAASSPEMYLEPSHTERTLVENGDPGAHTDVYATFERAVVRGEPTEVDCAAAAAAVDLMNAVLLAGYTGQRAWLPVDRSAVADWYAAKRARTTPQPESE